MHEDMMEMVLTFKDVVTKLNEDPVQLESFIAYVCMHIYASQIMFNALSLTWISCCSCKTRRYGQSQAQYSHLHPGRSQQGFSWPATYEDGRQEPAWVQSPINFRMSVSHGFTYKISQGSDISITVEFAHNVYFKWSHREFMEKANDGTHLIKTSWWPVFLYDLAIPYDLEHKDCRLFCGPILVQVSASSCDCH